MGFNWYDVAWTKVKEVTVPAAKVGGTGTVYDVRAYVDVTDADLQASAQADGDDILFTADDGVTKIPYELISYNPATGALEAWVLIPELDGVTGGTIFMYYGNGGCAAQEDPDGVWKDASTLPATAAYHFNGDVLDISGNSNDGTNDGTGDVAGKVGNARSFDGTNDSISAAGAGFVAVEADTTNAIVAWIKGDSTAPNVRQQIFYKGNTGKETLTLHLDDGGSAVFMVYLAGTFEYYAVGNTDLRDDAWHRVVGVRDGSTFKVIVDGVDDTAAVSEGSSSTSTTEDVLMGKRLNEDYFFKGDLDECWVLAGAPDVAWALTDYNATNDPATFLSFGAESTFVENDEEMNFFPMEEIVADDDMPWWHNPLVSDEEMPMTILEYLVDDDELPMSWHEHPDVTSDEEMQTTFLERLEVDRQMWETILEFIREDDEPVIPLFEEVYSDTEMVVSQSQDRADDLSMPMTILEELQEDPIIPESPLENIVSDLSMGASLLEQIIADGEMDGSSAEDQIVSDEEMPATFMEELAVDDELVHGILERIYGDEEMPAPLMEEIVSDREMPFFPLEITTYSDLEIPATLSEYLEVADDVPFSLLESVRADRSMRFMPLERIRNDAEIPISFMEYLEADVEPGFNIYQEIDSDEKMTMTLQEVIVADLAARASLAKALRSDLEMVLFLGEELAPTPVESDREMPMYLGEELRVDRTIPATLLEYIEAIGEMPMSWWDEVQAKIPTGIYRLLVQTYQYELEAMTETVAGERTETVLEKKS